MPAALKPASLPVALAALLMLCSLAGCASTTFTSTWKAPDATVVDPSGRRVAAVYITTDESSRRVAEDVLVRKLKEQGALAVPSYSLIPSSEIADTDAVRARLKEAQIDGVVTMRVIDERTRVDITPGSPAWPPYYSRFWGYWGYGWGAPYTPANVSTTTVLRIETLIYSLERDALLWAGTSRTVEPSNVAKLVEEVADAATKRMTSEGLLAPRKI